MKYTRQSITTWLAAVAAAATANAADLTKPIASADVVFDEQEGILAIESEHFYKQTLTEKRAWYLSTTEAIPELSSDGDPGHAAGASGGAYIEALPDTRRNHGQKLINGENFSNVPGKIAILHYNVKVNKPGRYYGWVRAFSTTSEDNGLHFGLNGEWPESGQRWQTVKKHAWNWDCKQRTEKVHVGVPMQLWLDIDKAGEHELQIAMREDGIELDKFVLAMDKEYRPEGVGPMPVVAKGIAPKPFKFIPSEAKQENLALNATDPEVAQKKPEPLVLPRKPNGDGSITITGELKQWHKVTLTLNGPYAHENDNAPNPFTDHAFNVTFVHQSGDPKYTVPGYFAADGNAGDTSADSGTQWRAHLSPDKAGKWNYLTTFNTGKNAALGKSAIKPATVGNMKIGSFTVAASNKTGRDFRSKGRLQYVGKHHLQFAGSKGYFLKAGADAPETMLAYADFDSTIARKKNAPLKTWAPHIKDWNAGDPTWKDGKGKGLIGGLNYLASKGVNSFSFLPYNAGGDGDNIWPFVQREDKMHYDCSKLDQWGVVFDHATTKGLYMHFKLQENEMDDDRRGQKGGGARVPESLDGGKLGNERKLYCRELIARFGHALALNWNIGEENTQSSAEVRDMVKYLHDTDPYDHNIVIHTFPNQQEKVYTPLLGDNSLLTGASLQNHWDVVHQRTLQWLKASAKYDRPWVVANDEQGSADTGVPPDMGFEGYDGKRKDGKAVQTTDDIRKYTLWGNLMAGGAGVEYYFGYQLPQNDLVCQDFRSRDQSWDYCRIALEFFKDNAIPFWDMTNADALIGNAKEDNSKYCLAKAGELYLVYLPNGGTTELNLSDAKAKGDFNVQWFNPRTGGALAAGSVATIHGGASASLGIAPADADQDWLVIVRK